MNLFQHQDLMQWIHGASFQSSRLLLQLDTQS